MVSLSHIIFEVTRSCNLNCLYCYNHWRPGFQGEKDPGHKLRFRTLKKILDSFDFTTISFTGGEPTLAGDLGELVLMARLRGKNVNVITNGSGIALDSFRDLYDLGVGFFEIPLHSFRPEIHDQMTTVDGSHSKAVRAITSILESGNRAVGVVVLTALNIQDLLGTMTYARKLGLQNLMLARFNLGGNGIVHRDELTVKLADLKKAFAQADYFAKTTGMSILANVCMPHCVITPEDFPSLGLSSCSEDFSQRPVTFDPEGNVRVCNHSPVTLGNIYKQTPERIFQSEYLEAWRSSIPIHCQPCQKWTKCRGGCRGASEQVYGTLEREDPVVGYYGVPRFD